MLHSHGAAEYYRHSTHNNKCCIVMAQLNTIDIVLTITNAALSWRIVMAQLNTIDIVLTITNAALSWRS